jgi:hypothetical protein
MTSSNSLMISILRKPTHTSLEYREGDCGYSSSSLRSSSQSALTQISLAHAGDNANDKSNGLFQRDLHISSIPGRFYCDKTAQEPTLD